MRFKYSKQTENLTDAFVRIVYNDGSRVEPLSKNYNGLKRTDMKSATIVSKNGINLYTLPIVNNKLIYRKRNLQKGIAGNDEDFNFSNPKRAILLETEGKIVFFWDSTEIKEMTTYLDYSPYRAPIYRKDEK